MTPICDLCQDEPGIYHVVLSPMHGEKDEEVTISAFYARSCLTCAQKPVQRWHPVMRRLREAIVCRSPEAPSESGSDG